MVISQLVTMSIDSYVAEAVAKLMLDHPNLNVADCDRLLAAFARHQQESLPRSIEGTKADYLMLMNSVAAVQNGELGAREAIEMSGSTLPQHLRIEKLDFESEYAAVSNLIRLALQDAIKPFSQLGEKTQFDLEFERLSQLVEAQAKLGNRQVPLMTILISPMVRPVILQLARTETTITGLQALLALRRYELINGSLPAKLEAATSEAGFAAIPQDIYSGAPLKSTVNGGAAVVYSVGIDRRDDGGKLDWKFGTQPGDFLFRLPPLPEGMARSGAASLQSESPRNNTTENKQQPRTWTSTVGTTIEATYVTSDVKGVVLRKVDGKEITVPLEKLSQADRDWINAKK